MPTRQRDAMGMNPPAPPRPGAGKAMPDEEIAGAVEADSASAAADHDGAAEAATPMATEPIVADTLETVSAVLPIAIERLTDGQVQAPVQIDGLDQLEKVPVGIAKWVLALGAMTQDPNMLKRAPALKQYAFDPMEALTSNDGLVAAVANIDRLSQDPKVLAAFKQGPPGGGAPPSPAAQPAPTRPPPEEEL